jgi:hypothetical protein
VIPPTRRRSFPRVSVAGCDVRTAPEGNRAIGTAPTGPVPPHDRKDRPPRRSVRRSTLQSPLAWAMKFAGLGIVANGLIGDDGATKRAKGLQRIYWLILCRSPILELV